MIENYSAIHDQQFGTKANGFGGLDTEFTFNKSPVILGQLTRLKKWMDDGVLQLASFHPDYQFAGTDPDDVTNATNRSPYPTLHLIREESIDRAVQAFPDAAAIYETNIATMEALGEAGWTDLLAACRDDAAASGCGATPSDPSRGQPS